jgi:S1-C subfamily serine protease
MLGPSAVFLAAGLREEGCTCPHCGQATQQGSEIAVCSQCGTVHHRSCWTRQESCGSYNCAPARRQNLTGGEPAWRITAEDLAAAMPLPARTAVGPAVLRVEPPRTSRLAVAAFVTSLAGIPFFGAVTGLVAILLGSLALGGLRASQQRGSALALAGVLLGLLDVVGWVVFLCVFLSRPTPGIELGQFEYDPAALENADPMLKRAMRATVLIEASQGGVLGRTVVGSGVVLALKEHEALIVTNQHVVVPDFPDGGSETEGLPPVRVYFIGQGANSGKVVWRAPGAIDLALVRVQGDTSQAQAALWAPGRPVRVGEPAFAIGNPHRLGWTHTQGVISQLRRQHVDGHDVRVIQTQTALNPGNSGGGLFDHEGYLLGINTWTNDRRVSEGLNFAIALETLLELKPPALPIPPAAGVREKR